LGPGDLEDALALYRELVGEGDVPAGDAARARFDAVILHPGTTVFGAQVGGRIMSVATLHILPNMTRGGRPYALIENVVTAARYRGRGLGRGVMAALVEAARGQDANKIMLLTGTDTGARGFYRKCGFEGETKHAMTLRFVPPRRVSGDGKP
jgi:GNAT superfamily N-acetyltransferase